MGRVRAASVSIVFGVTLAMACSRVANQTNLIGSPCKTEADCPAELICFQGQTCQERCTNGDACEDSTKTCVNGACVAGGKASDDGGGLTEAPNFSDSGTGGPGMDGSNGGGPATSSGVGTTVIENLQLDQLRAAAAGANYAAFSGTAKDQFGGTITKLQAISLAGGAQPISVQEIAGNAGLMGVSFVGDTLFWVENSGSNKIRKFPLPGGPAQDVTTLTGGTPDVGVRVYGNYMFLSHGGGAGLLERYDLVGAGGLTTVDSQAAKIMGMGGDPWGSVEGSSDGTNLYWIHAAPSPGQPQPIYKGLVASGTGSATAASIPANAQVAFFDVNGTTALMGVNTTQFSLYPIDTVGGGSPGASILQLQGLNGIVRDGGFLYAFVSNGGANAIKKFSVTDGTPTTVADLGNFGSVRQVSVGTTDVVWIEGAGGPSPTFRIAKMAK